MVHDFDMVILGGGLIGSTLAASLSGAGFDVALVDPVATDERGAPDFDGRAYAIAPGSQRLLSAIGVWPKIADQAQPVRAIHVQDQQTDPVPPAALHFDPAEVGEQSLGWIVEDRFLRQALIGAVEDTTIEHNAPATGHIVERGTGWAVVEADGQTLRARLVIACDGRRSATARTAGIEYIAWGYRQVGLVSAISHSVPHDGLAHQSFYAGGPFAVLPLTNDRSSIVWSERAERAAQIQSMSDQAYLAEITQRIAGRLGTLDLAGQRQSHPLGLSLASEFSAHRLALVGDAAHGVHPIAGQGLNMGLRDVAALAEVLIEATRRGEDIGAENVLERYQRWRRPDATMMALGMDGLTRLFSTASSPAQALRNVGLSAVSRSGAVRQGLMGLASGLSGDVPRLLRGQAL